MERLTEAVEQKLMEFGEFRRNFNALGFLRVSCPGRGFWAEMGIEGFEPSGTHPVVFKTTAIDRSAIRPETRPLGVP